MKSLNSTYDRFIFVEHTPDMGSKLDFYHETFDLVNFEWNGESLVNPKWRRLTAHEVDEIMQD
jgi:hypothetical protein